MSDNIDDIELKQLAANLRNEFNETADRLDVHVTRINGTRIGGGVVGVLGGVAAIVGLALIPVTLGVSALTVALPGSIVAGVAGATAGGASIAKIFIEKNKLGKVKVQWDKFRENFIEVLKKKDPEMFQKLEKQLKKIGDKADKGPTAEVAKAANVFMGIAKACGAEGAKLAARDAAAGAAAVAPTAGRVVARLAMAGSIVLTVAMMGFSIYDIIDGSYQIHKQTGSKAGDYLRVLANSLDEYSRTGFSMEFLLQLASQQQAEQE